MKKVCLGSSLEKSFQMSQTQELKSHRNLFLKQNFKVLIVFKKFKVVVEKESRWKIKAMRFYRGCKITSKEFYEFYEANRIRHLLTIPRSP